jgi:hypothetical protein
MAQADKMIDCSCWFLADEKKKRQHEKSTKSFAVLPR